MFRSSWHSRKMRGVILVVLAAAFFATGAYALTASNTFTANGGRAGDGSGPVTGYTISAVHYTLDANTPQVISSWQVTLTIAGGGTVNTLYSRLLDSGGNALPAGSPWVACTPTNSTGPFTCTPAPANEPSTYQAMTIQVAASS
jgi:hypothetical protein